jgi:hypothetical protein
MNFCCGIAILVSMVAWIIPVAIFPRVHPSMAAAPPLDVDFTSPHHPIYHVKSMHLNSHLKSDLINAMVNHSHDACAEPFDHACRMGRVKTIRESSEEHGRMLRLRVEEQHIGGSPFVRKCEAFHGSFGNSETSPALFQRIVSSRLFQEQWALLDEASFRDASQLESILGTLLTYGTRALLEVSQALMKEGSDLRIQRSPPIASGFHCEYAHRMRECSVREQKLLRHFIAYLPSSVNGVATLNLDKALQVDALFEWDPNADVNLDYTQQEITTTTSAFRYDQYLEASWHHITPGKQSILANDDFMSILVSQRRMISLESWRNYLRISVLYHIMVHLRLGGTGAPVSMLYPTPESDSAPLTPHSLCIKQYEQLFPLHVCLHIKEVMRIDTYAIKQLFRRTKDAFVKWIRRDSERVLGTTPAYRAKMEKKLMDVQIVADRCWMFQDESHRKFFFDMESSLLSWMQDERMSGESITYEDVVYHVFRHETRLLQFRNHYMDKYVRNLAETFVSWNGWYSRAENTLVLTSGFAHFVMTRLENDGCIAETVIPILMAHEITHELHWQAQEEGGVPSLWLQLLERLKADYRIESDGVVRELFSDWLGLQVAFSIHQDSTVDAKLCFFRTCIKLWCTDNTRAGYVSDRDRASLCIRAGSLGSYYEELHQCRLT